MGELNIMPPKLGSCDWETASKKNVCIFVLYVSKILYFLHVQGFHFQSFLRGVWGTSYLAIGAQPCFLPKLPTLGGGTMYGTYFIATAHYTLPETDSSHLKMDDWKTSFLLGMPIFRGYVR